MLLIASDELLPHLAAAVLGHCQRLRRDGLAVPADLAQLRDDLHGAARRRQEATPFEPAVQPVERVTVSAHEAAQRLGLSGRTVDRMIADGRLEVVRVGRRVLVPMSELERIGRTAA